MYDTHITLSRPAHIIAGEILGTDKKDLITKILINYPCEDETVIFTDTSHNDGGLFEIIIRLVSR